VSDYVRERAERVLGLLDDEDGKVMAEYIRNKQAEAQESQRYRYEGPPWGVWLLAAVLAGPCVGGTGYGAVGCWQNEELREGERAGAALRECQDELAKKQVAIVKLGEACGLQQVRP
jgi:hypothetical protein